MDRAAEKKTRSSGLKPHTADPVPLGHLAAEKKTRFSGLKRRDLLISAVFMLAAEKKTRFSGLKPDASSADWPVPLCRREEDAL